MKIAELIHLRDQLKIARLSGIRELVDQNGERISYKSDAEMRAALDSVEIEIARQGGAPSHTILFKTSKGL